MAKNLNSIATYKDCNNVSQSLKCITLDAANTGILDSSDGKNFYMSSFASHNYSANQLVKWSDLCKAKAYISSNVADIIPSSGETITLTFHAAELKTMDADEIFVNIANFDTTQYQGMVSYSNAQKEGDSYTINATISANMESEDRTFVFQFQYKDYVATTATLTQQKNETDGVYRYRIVSFSDTVKTYGNFPNTGATITTDDYRFYPSVTYEYSTGYTQTASDEIIWDDNWTSQTVQLDQSSVGEASYDNASPSSITFTNVGGETSGATFYATFTIPETSQIISGDANTVQCIMEFQQNAKSVVTSYTEYLFDEWAYPSPETTVSGTYEETVTTNIETYRGVAVAYYHQRTATEMTDGSIVYSDETIPSGLSVNASAYVVDPSSINFANVDPNTDTIVNVTCTCNITFANTYEDGQYTAVFHKKPTEEYVYTLYSPTYNTTVTFKNGETVLATKTIEESSLSEGLYNTSYSMTVSEGEEYDLVTAIIEGGEIIGSAITDTHLSINPSSWDEKETTAITVNAISFYTYKDTQWITTVYNIPKNDSSVASTTITFTDVPLVPTVKNRNSFITISEPSIEGNFYTYSLTTSNPYDATVTAIHFNNSILDSSANRLYGMGQILQVTPNNDEFTYTLYTPYSRGIIQFFDGDTLLSTNQEISKNFDREKSLWFARYTVKNQIPYESITATISGRPSTIYDAAHMNIDPLFWNEGESSSIQVFVECYEAYTSNTWSNTSFLIEKNSSDTATTTTTTYGTAYGKPTMTNENSFISVSELTASGNGYTCTLTTSDPYNLDVVPIEVSYYGKSSIGCVGIINIMPSTVETTYTVYTPFNNAQVEFYYVTETAHSLGAIVSDNYDAEKDLYYATLTINTEPYEFLVAVPMSGNTGTTYGTYNLTASPTSWDMSTSSGVTVGVTTSVDITTVTWDNPMGINVYANSTVTATTTTTQATVTQFNTAPIVNNPLNNYVACTKVESGANGQYFTYTFSTTDTYNPLNDTHSGGTITFNYSGATADVNVSKANNPTVTFKKVDGIGTYDNTYSTTFAFGSKLVFPSLTAQQTIGLDGWYYEDGTQATTADTITQDVTILAHGDVLKWSDGTNEPKTYETEVPLHPSTVTCEIFSYKYSGLTIEKCDGYVRDTTYGNVGSYTGSLNATTPVSVTFTNNYFNHDTESTTHVYTIVCGTLGKSLQITVPQQANYIITVYTEYRFGQWLTTDLHPLLDCYFEGDVNPSDETVQTFTYRTRTANRYADGNLTYGEYSAYSTAPLSAITTTYNPSTLHFEINYDTSPIQKSTIGTQTLNAEWSGYQWSTRPSAHTFTIEYTQEGDTIDFVRTTYIFDGWLKTTGKTFNIECTDTSTHNALTEYPPSGFTYKISEETHWQSGVISHEYTAYTASTSDTTYSCSPTSNVTFTRNTDTANTVAYDITFTQNVSDTFKNAKAWEQPLPTNEYTIKYVQEKDSVTSGGTIYEFVNWANTNNILIDLAYNDTSEHSVTSDAQVTSFTYKATPYSDMKSGNRVLGTTSTNTETTGFTVTASPSTVKFSSANNNPVQTQSLNSVVTASLNSTWTSRFNSDEEFFKNVTYMQAVAPAVYNLFYTDTNSTSERYVSESGTKTVQVPITSTLNGNVTGWSISEDGGVSFGKGDSPSSTIGISDFLTVSAHTASTISENYVQLSFVPNDANYNDYSKSYIITQDDSGKTLKLTVTVKTNKGVSVAADYVVIEYIWPQSSNADIDSATLVNSTFKSMKNLPVGYSFESLGNTNSVMTSWVQYGGDATGSTIVEGESVYLERILLKLNNFKETYLNASNSASTIAEIIDEFGELSLPIQCYCNNRSGGYVQTTVKVRFFNGGSSSFSVTNNELITDGAIEDTAHTVTITSRPLATTDSDVNNFTFGACGWSNYTQWKDTYSLSLQFNLRLSDGTIQQIPVCGQEETYGFGISAVTINRTTANYTNGSIASYECIPIVNSHDEPNKYSAGISYDDSYFILNFKYLTYASSDIRNINGIAVKYTGESDENNGSLVPQDTQLYPNTDSELSFKVKECKFDVIWPENTSYERYVSFYVSYYHDGKAYKIYAYKSAYGLNHSVYQKKGNVLSYWIQSKASFYTFAPDIFYLVFTNTGEIAPKNSWHSNVAKYHGSSEFPEFPYVVESYQYGSSETTYLPVTITTSYNFLEISNIQQSTTNNCCATYNLSCSINSSSTSWSRYSEAITYSNGYQTKTIDVYILGSKTFELSNEYLSTSYATYWCDLSADTYYETGGTMVMAVTATTGNWGIVSGNSLVTELKVGTSGSNDGSAFIITKIDNEHLQIKVGGYANTATHSVDLELKDSAANVIKLKIVQQPKS